MAYRNTGFGAILEVGSQASSEYAQGLLIIKELFAALTSYITTPSQVFRSKALTLATLTASLKQGLTEDEWQNWVRGLAQKKTLFMKIPMKTLNNWKEVIDAIANSVAVDGLATRKDVDSIWLSHPEYMASSKTEKALIVAKATKDVAVTASKAVVGTFDFIGKAKYFLLAGGLGYVAYKLLTQSDKVKAAYNTVKGDAGVLYGRMKARK